MASTRTSVSDFRLSRRGFLARTAVGATALALQQTSLSGLAEEPSPSPVAVFTKVYQELNLDFATAAAVTAEAGLDGVDCPVREGGEISPEKAADQLPHYAEVLARRKLRILLLTTGIISLNTPFAETILRAAKKVGLRYYRLGFIHREPGDRQLREVKAQLKDLAGLNRELELCTLLQNHSPSGETRYFGGDLTELNATVDSLDPSQVGVAFDIGHALVVHGASWRQYFEALQPHFKVAYVKDVKPGAGWVPFGEGDIGRTGYFELLRKTGYHEPISLHVEFDWSEHGKAKNQASLVQALRKSSNVLRHWLAA